MTGHHHLAVPDDPDVTMEIVHPPSCPQGRKKALVRDAFGDPACPYERVLRAAAGGGLDAWFRREAEEHPFFPGTVRVPVGRHPLVLDEAGQLRLAAEIGGAA